MKKEGLDQHLLGHSAGLTTIVNQPGNSHLPAQGEPLTRAAGYNEISQKFAQYSEEDSWDFIVTCKRSDHSLVLCRPRVQTLRHQDGPGVTRTNGALLPNSSNPDTVNTNKDAEWFV